MLYSARTVDLERNLKVLDDYLLNSSRDSTFQHLYDQVSATKSGTVHPRPVSTTRRLLSIANLQSYLKLKSTKPETDL